MHDCREITGKMDLMRVRGRCFRDAYTLAKASHIAISSPFEVFDKK